MAKDRYQISLWEDAIKPESTVIRDGEEIVIPEHFEEFKLCDIGADDMTSTCRAYEPQLIENINGTNTFKFKMYYVYRDDGGEGELLQNPYLNLLVNERKVKVLWKDKWYDFVIKDINEDSSGKSITYTCTDLFINELSKNGFNLEFDTELENNQGTAEELVEKVLEGTDWKLGSNNDIIQQEIEEPVYEAITLSEEEFENQTQEDPEESPIPRGAKVLIFYNQLQDILNGEAASGTATLQFAYAENYQRDSKASQLVVNSDCYRGEFSWTKDDTYLYLTHNSNAWVTLAYKLGVSTEYRANRLVESQQTILDPLTGKYVRIYIANKDGAGYSQGDTIYGYQSTEYKDPTYVNNLLVNNSNFSGLEGWVNTGSEWLLYPSYTKSNDLTYYEAKSYLKLNSSLSSCVIYNDGIHSSTAYLKNGFISGEIYIFRYKAMRGNATAPNGVYFTASNSMLTLAVKKANENKQPVGDSYFQVITRKNGSDHWVEMQLKCVKSASLSEIISNKISTFLVTIAGNAYVWLEEAQFFPEVFGMVTENGQVTKVRINPGEMDVMSLANVVTKYYNHTASGGLVDASGVTYFYSGEDFTPVMNEDYVKIRSINIKQSNRFNILQTIAETFECWMRFEIEHNQSTGSILYIDGEPCKTVSIKKEIGQETGIGFIYGLDLKTIQRNIKSSDIVTKTIVSPNNNEFAQDGFCTIARSEENYPRETFILDFGYYITHGLLDGNLLNRDLYLSDPSGGSLGYYYNLNQLNTTYDQQIELLANRKNELTKQESYEEVYNQYLTSLQSERDNLESQIKQLSNTTSMSAATAYAQKNPGYTDLVTKINARTTCINNITTYQKLLNQLQSSITNLKDDIERIEEEQEITVEALKTLHEAFYKKYSRFIQEGSWTSEEYIDDNLYYLDAQSVAYTSSRPQVSYNISVYRISAIEEFKNRVFRLGDISFIQDTEFFGYVTINGIKTPYHEKVLVSEVTSNFDSPEKDTFKVQNYKTQFEDLFQRITATTQSLQYASGEYARAANAIESDGTINPETLQSSIELNSQLVYSARNDAIIQDSTGITVTDSTNPSHKTKVTSGGVFITTDGGLTWKSAIRGEGMATQYLTSGAINTENITILDGNAKTFRWDSQGISAFAKYSGSDSIDVSTFMRFDRYGMYGITGIEQFAPQNEAEVWDNAQVALTWRGFMLNNIEGDGRTTITSDNDIQVFGPAAEQTNSRSVRNEVERIKIGRLYTSTNENGYTWDSGAVPSATPNPSTVYYVYDDSSGGYIKDGLRYFEDGVNYFEGSDSKTLTTDTIPIIDKSYYVATLYAPAVLPRQFSPDTTYYEEVTDNQYVITQDITPQNGKDYFLPTEPYIPLEGLEEFESGITYYELNEEGEYEETQDVSPVEGKIYYVTVEEKPSLAEFVAADLEYYFEDGVPYFVWNEASSEYDLVTEVTPNPEVSYAVVDAAQGGWTEKVAGGTPDGFPRAFQDKAYYTRDEIVYGIRISDSTGTPVMEQNGDGDLWMTGALHISNSYLHQTQVRYDNYDIRLGYLESDGNESYYQHVTEDQVISGKNYYIYNGTGYVLVDDPIDQDLPEYYELVSIHQIFNVNSGNFIVYENGTVYALNGHFSGDVEAHSGMFGTRNDDGTGNYVIVNDNGLKAYNGGLAVYKQDSLYKVAEDLQEFDPEVTYYELIEDEYVITEDETPQEGKTYYTYQEEQLVFGYDPISGYLTVAGGATLTGAIEATSGSFSGNIYAAGGQIGGFVISHQYDSTTDTWVDSLNSVQGQYVKTTDTQIIEGKTYYTSTDGEWQEVENPLVSELDNYYELYANVQLYGNSGTIITNSLHMGTVENADVEITLGNARLYNPQLREGREFIEIVDNNNQQIVALTDEAILRLGNIMINGNTSILNLGDPDSESYILLDGSQQIIASGSERTARNYFSISNSGATFNNVNIKGKITASIFETGKIQTVGGAFLFKPTARVLEISETNSVIELTLDGTSSEFEIFNVDDYVQLIDNQQQVNPNFLFKIVEHDKTSTPEQLKIERVLGDFTVDSDNVPFGIIDIGPITDQTNPILVGINSSDTSLVHLPARGITVSEFSIDDYVNPTTSTTKVKAFLGDLSQIQTQVDLPNSPGYGLYSDNVFLTGMLATSKYNQQSAGFVYAGVNTLNGEVYLGPGGQPDPSRPGAEYGNIVFWGGAKSVSGEIDIQSSPFVVTDKGYMYARDGFFTGSIWVEGDIYGADIYTSRIHGNHQGEGYGLGIFDTTTGIIFGHDWESDNSYIVDYKLNNSGLLTRNNTSDVPIIQINGTGTSALSVDMYGTFNTSNTDNYYKLDANGLQFGQELNGEYTKLGNISISNDDITLAYGTTNKVQIQANTTILNNEIDYGENFQYKPAQGGYDLYVTAAVSSGA